MSKSETVVPFHDIRGYRRGCRCEPCKAGNSEYQRAYYQKRKAAAAAALEAEKTYPVCKVCGRPDTGHDHSHIYCIPSEGAR